MRPQGGALSWGRLVLGMLFPGDGSSRGQFLQGSFLLRTLRAGTHLPGTKHPRSQNDQSQNIPSPNDQRADFWKWHYHTNCLPLFTSILRHFVMVFSWPGSFGDGMFYNWLFCALGCLVMGHCVMGPFVMDRLRCDNLYVNRGTRVLGVNDTAVLRKQTCVHDYAVPIWNDMKPLH
jgi:hypothetical protein